MPICYYLTTNERLTSHESYPIIFWAPLHTTAQTGPVLSMMYLLRLMGHIAT